MKRYEDRVFRFNSGTTVTLVRTQFDHSWNPYWVATYERGELFFRVEAVSKVRAIRTLKREIAQSVLQRITGYKVWGHGHG